MSKITLGKRVLEKGQVTRPYFIAEAGVNHEGDLGKAMLMIDQAARAGADAIKFQTYKAERLASKNSPAYWDTAKEKRKSQYELFRVHDKFWKKEFDELAKHSQKKGIDFLSTPFDHEAVDILEPWVPAYKVASADITNFPLLKHIANTGKPVLLSTGASSISEIYDALRVLQASGNDQIVLLHCVLNYPTAIEDANLGMIWHMERVFPEHVIGYSDHTLPEYANDVLSAAWLLGAQVIEKHFTFDKSLPGNDHYHAMDRTDLEAFQEHVDFLIQTLGRFRKEPLPSEAMSRLQARRSLVAARSISKGEILAAKDILVKRPGTGIPPIFFEQVIGSEALRDLQEDEVITFDAVRLKKTALPDDKQA